MDFNEIVAPEFNEFVTPVTMKDKHEYGNYRLHYNWNDIGVSPEEIEGLCTYRPLLNKDRYTYEVCKKTALEVVKSIMVNEDGDTPDAKLDEYIDSHRGGLLDMYHNRLEEAFADVAHERMEAIVDDYEIKMARYKLAVEEFKNIPTEESSEYVMKHIRDLEVEFYPKNTTAANLLFYPGDLKAQRATFPEFRRTWDPDYVAEHTPLMWRPRNMATPIPENVYKERMNLLEPEDRKVLEEKFNEGPEGNTLLYRFFGGAGNSVSSLEWTDTARECVKAFPDPDMALRIFTASASCDGVRNNQNGLTYEKYKTFITGAAKIDADYRKAHDSLVKQSSPKTKSNDFLEK